MDVESFSSTLYFSPLFPAVEIIHSHASSKSANVSSEIMSKPASGWPSACTGLLSLAAWTMAPSFTLQSPAGVCPGAYPRPCQPLSVEPSKSSRHPAFDSAADRVLGLDACAVAVCEEATRHIT